MIRTRAGSSPRSEAKASGWSHVRHAVLCTATHTFANWTSFIVTHVIFFIVECGVARFLCAMHVIDVLASSSSPRLTLYQISFLLRPPAHGEKSHTHKSITHPAYLMPGNRSFRSGKRQLSTALVFLICANRPG